MDSMKEQLVISYQNPVGGMTEIGDPFVLKTNDLYYMFATSEPSRGFKVWKSKNLVDWDDEGLAYDHEMQPEEWATGDFWAPEVIYHRNKYFMTYSARDRQGHLKIAIAASESPSGPFIDICKDIVRQEGSYIDGHIFKEDDGTLFFYYVKDCSENIINGKHVSQIFVQPLNDDLTQLVGEPQLLLEPDSEWEGLDADFQWNEGPFVIKHQEKYYLMYSANFFGSADYSVGYAIAEHPMGHFIKAEENPILVKDLEKGISGPGHNSVTTSLSGNDMYIVYHTHTFPDNPSGNRQMNIDRLYVEDGKLKVDGPTANKQYIFL
ncbi:glycoside hydrolase family 43 protein [Lederbergia citri]|uniref:Glycoside hydrolase family 43 protein n=1 Tax=Lederbergia citri TaxID=2833580 RepID=A0A942TD89_9BACI|nr:glycoside hydrolase family 43 protein [Lederbergia citri]MBS4195578.1 glycoside hydrolase family 43 protein [Lederbergia citri]